jgi:hypothetical protein
VEDEGEVPEGDEEGIYSKKKYHRRSKDETVFSVIKRTMGDEVRSVKTRAQDNEMRFRVIACNAERMVNLACSLVRGFLVSRDDASAVRKFLRTGLFCRNSF